MCVSAISPSSEHISRLEFYVARAILVDEMMLTGGEYY